MHSLSLSEYNCHHIRSFAVGLSFPHSASWRSESSSPWLSPAFPKLCDRLWNMSLEHTLLSITMWKWKLLSCVQLFGTPRTIQSMEFSRPEYWREYSILSPGDLPDPGTESGSPALQEDFYQLSYQGSPSITKITTLITLSFFPYSDMFN